MDYINFNNEFNNEFNDTNTVKKISLSTKLGCFWQKNMYNF